MYAWGSAERNFGCRIGDKTFAERDDKEIDR